MDIIPAEDTHYPGIASVLNLIYPESHDTAAEIEEGDRRRDPRYKFQRWVAVEDNRVIGTGYYTQSCWFDHPQKFLVWVGVTPEYQKCGIGSRLFEIVLQGLEQYDPLALRTTVRDQFTNNMRFLQKRGFQEVIRDIRSELNPQSFDLSRYADLDHRCRGLGIAIKTLPELEGDPERNQKLYDLDWDLSLAVPGDLAAGIGRRGLDKYVEYAITGPDALPKGFFVAVKGDEYIGLSHALTIEKGVSLYHGLTGVKPPYQRLGIGLALKVRVIAYAKASGHVTIKTDNDAKNLPMLRMNERLGYRRVYDLITFEKQLQPAVAMA